MQLINKSARSQKRNRERGVEGDWHGWWRRAAALVGTRHWTCERRGI